MQPEPGVFSGMLFSVIRVISASLIGSTAVANLGRGMSRYEIRIAGLGGQGIVLLGVILAKAIAENEKLHVVQTQSYGPESRGGAVRADLVISDEPIDYPKVRKADILVAMSQPAFETYLKDLKGNGILVIDPDLVELNTQRSDFIVKQVAATKKAAHLGKAILANMIMLGALLNIINIASKQAAISALSESIPKNTLQENVKAVEAGLEIRGS